MSSFGGIRAAFSGLVAARTGLDTVGANIANVNTPGYVRRQVVQESTLAAQDTHESGVQVTGIRRMNNEFADEAVRNATTVSAYRGTVATTAARVEDTTGEPSSTGLSARLDKMWGDFQALSNAPTDDTAARTVISSARSVAQALADASAATGLGWSRARAEAASNVEEINRTAQSIADLNGKILDARTGGADVNALIDKRDELIADMARLTGARTTIDRDGNAEVTVGGSLMVGGTSARQLALVGSTRLADASTDPVQVRWTDRPDSPAELGGGELAARIESLAAARPDGNGGAWAEASAVYDRIATTLATRVNAVHSGGVRADGGTSGDFFGIDAGVPIAQGLRVLPTDAAGIAVRTASGASTGDAVSNLALAPDGPSAAWADWIGRVGETSRAATAGADTADAAASVLTAERLSHTSVDTDEETLDMLSYQHAFQGAARVISAMDEMLDTLINRTGVVGR